MFALVVSLLLIINCLGLHKKTQISASVAFIISASLETFYQRCSEYFHELIGESVFVFYFSLLPSLGVQSFTLIIIRLSESIC